MGYDIEPDQNSQLLFTYDDEPNMVKEFDMKTDKKMEKMYYLSRRYLAFPQTFQFQTKKRSTMFFEDAPEFVEARGKYVLKTLKQIFHHHVNWSISKPSVHNCVYYMYDPTKQHAISILKISFNRYLFAYQPKCLDKTEVEQIVFDLFTP